MRLLVLLALVGLAFAAPQNPQVYAFDYYNHKENSAQFLRRNGDTYSWGYEFPERVHLENSDGPGHVDGSYGYVDANGVPVLVQYQSHPENGFTADIQQAPSVQAFPASRSQSVPTAEVRSQYVHVPERSQVAHVRDFSPDVEVSPYNVPTAVVRSQVSHVRDFSPDVDVRELEVSPYTALLKELPLEGNLAGPAPLLAMVPQVPLVLTPLLKAAIEQGKITQFEILEDGSSTFAVSPAAVDEAGSVSNLAVQLGASLPAAVHDVRSPNPSTQEARPALDFQNNFFVLRVPAADPRLGPAVIEI